MFTSFFLCNENDTLISVRVNPRGTVCNVLNFNLQYLNLPLLVQHLTVWYAMTLGTFNKQIRVSERFYSSNTFF